MEIRLIVFVVCVFFATCAAFFIALISSTLIKAYINGKDGGAIDDSGEICWTKECVLAAASLLNNMDETVDPCDNFYQFACNNFQAETVLSSKPIVTPLFMLADKVDEQLGRIFEEPIKNTEPKFVKQAKMYYQSCMNTALIESRGTKPLLRMLKALGGWPLLEDSWNGSSFNWMNTIFQFRERGLPDNYFIDFGPIIDKKNSSRRSITIDQPPLSLRREYLTGKRGLGEPEVIAYRKFQISVATYLGADPIRAQKEMLDILTFEIKLANLSATVEERRNLTRQYNPMTIRELQNRWQSIPWLEYLNKLLPESVQVDENEVVIMAAPEYFDGFETLIRETDKRIIANYAMWRAVQSSITYLNDNLHRIELVYLNSLIGMKEREPRWRECTVYISESLGNAVGALYIRHYFKEEYKQDVLEMVANIKDAFFGILNDLEWMDPITKSRAIEKAKSMYAHIGYPVELLNDTILEEFYKGLELNSWDYFENYLTVTKFLTNQAYGKLREIVNKTDWRTHGKPAVVNAYYGPFENAIEFPAGILQGAFYNNHRPKYMNYAAIGMVMGHELTHGFDDRGSQYDIDGNMNNWWEETTRKSFLERTQCVIDQYNNYTVAELLGMHLNGIVTQGENIADNGGLKEAHTAYQAWAKRNKPEPRLPGLNKFTVNQLFWISSANIWCSKYKKEALRSRVLLSPHPPGEFRVIGSVSNSPAFAEDFNCPLGTNMNPVHKCSVW